MKSVHMGIEDAHKKWWWW